MIARRFKSLPLFWKILVPFLTLMLVVGGFGAFLIVRTLTARAENALEQDLSRLVLEARSAVRDAELSLLESATLAANLEGMAAAIAEGDVATIRRLAESVLALKIDLALLAVTDRSGSGLVELTRSGGVVRQSPARSWTRDPLVVRAAGETGARKHAGMIRDATMLGIASPVCGGTTTCDARGLAIVGIPLADAATAHETAAGARPSVAIYDENGRLVASAGRHTAAPRPPASSGDAMIRESRTVGDEAVATLYAPLTVQGRPVGRLAVSIPSAPAFATTREAAVRLGLVLLAAMAGIVALGALVSRLILAQVRPLVSANRAFGAGDLAVRVPVLGEDELGELARGVNQMAERLQASHETLELRVALRTTEVQRLLQERTEFFAAISHELRTPLAVIIAAAELMRDPTHQKTPQWTSRTGETIGDSATQLLSLVNDILDLARAEAGRLAVSIADVDLAEAVASIRPTVEGLAGAGEIEAVFEADEQLLVRADPARLREVLVNLADNAVKYTPPRGRISVTARRREDGFVEVAVSDTGIGIPPEIGERIFEPFFRVAGSEPQRGQASSGLGLALARRLVEAQGGTISYWSDERGTTFTFTVPASPATARLPQRSAPRRTAGR
jgi:signal transduction histidine kinase